MKKFGECGWDDVETGKEGMEHDYLVMSKPASYRIRVLGAPFQYYSHWTTDAKGNPRKVNCTGEATCIGCKKEGRAKARWLFRVIDRNETIDSIKILDCGQQILNSLNALRTDKDWGPLEQYDVKIKRGKKGSNPLYTVAPIPKEELSEDDEILKKNSLEVGGEFYLDLAKIAGAWSNAQIKEALDGK